jgi:hypothetical protein
VPDLLASGFRAVCGPRKSQAFSSEAGADSILVRATRGTSPTTFIVITPSQPRHHPHSLGLNRIMDQPRSLGPPPRPAWDPEPPPPTGRIGVDKANGRVTFPDGHIYTFQDHSLLTTAISYRNWGLGRPPNQPLALYGDTIIRAILCHRWITHSGDISKPHLSIPHPGLD